MAGSNKDMLFNDAGAKDLQARRIQRVHKSLQTLC